MIGNASGRSPPLDKKSIRGVFDKETRRKPLAFAADAVRAFFCDVLKSPHVDAGHGWLIFAAPPGEIAVHPADEPGSPELYLMCTDIKATIVELERKGVEFLEPVSDQCAAARTGRVS